MCRIMDVVIFSGDLNFAKVLLILHDSQEYSAGNYVISSILHMTGLIIISCCVVNLLSMPKPHEMPL